MFALVWSGAPLVGWSSYIPEGLGTWCSVDWRPYSYSNILYIILLFLISYVLPIILIVGSYMSVWMKVREVSAPPPPISVMQYNCDKVRF